MPEISHQRIRGRHIIGKYEVEFDANGIATVPDTVYNAVKGLRGFKQLGQNMNMEEVAKKVNAASDESDKKPAIAKKKIVLARRK